MNIYVPQKFFLLPIPFGLMASAKRNIGARFWWILPLLAFDFLYYYFVQYLIERNTDGGLIMIHGEALFFLFIVSLVSIGCVQLSDKILSRFNLTRLPYKYLISLFTSFIIFITVVISIQYSVEFQKGPKPISYLLSHSMIFLFLHLIVGNATIAVFYFNTSLKLSERLLQLEKVKVEKDLKILQQQMSPHFLFNNLNTLTALIPEDQEKAIQFTRKLSAIFRHATDYADKELIPLSAEFQFAEDYMELLAYRFGNSYQLNASLSSLVLSDYLTIPMSLQVVFENVVKHNTSSKAHPLIITLENDPDYLIFKNQIKPKLNDTKSRNGIGLKNLNQQYELVTGKSILISNDNAIFTIKIPLIKQIRDEDIDN